jgi:hypothetical protein
MIVRSSFLAVLACCAVAAGPAFAATGVTSPPMTSFPTSPGTETEPSMGRFDILVAPTFWGAVTTDCGGLGACGAGPLAGYTTQSFVDTIAGTTYQFLQLTSPVLFDPQTSIDVGAVFTNGSGLAQVNTSVQSLDLTNSAGTSVLAGPGPGVSPASLGAVVAQTAAQGSTVANSNSSFMMFVNISTPALPTPLFNTTPLVVEGDDLTSLPPTLVYTHTPATGFVPIDFFDPGTSTDVFFGDMALAGHGINFCLDPTNPVTCTASAPLPDPPGDLQAFYEAEITAFNLYNAANLVGAPVITESCSDPDPCATDPFFLEQTIIDTYPGGLPGSGGVGDPVPEPATWGILLFGFAVLCGMTGLRRRLVLPSV